MELCRKEKDLHLLYRALRDKLKTVVRDASDPHLLLAAARIVQEEERREGQPGGLGAPGGWRGTSARPRSRRRTATTTWTTCSRCSTTAPP